MFFSPRESFVTTQPALARLSETPLLDNMKLSESDL